ncbi:hypothetical protein [Nostoc sp. TCL26-01]|uniref:hypothetical protein n=1 Tax=Nostoc sp. TCL26-01 TaxID=2576904 RepID=UPI0015BC402E|nr:hypothetical protein [Nostoc sp. TCL26-01]QLE55209.1 hypothetical protein FD725_06600 [Nostoc sp. TCL26-01]
MRYIFFSWLLPFAVTCFARNALAVQYQSSSSLNHTLAVVSTDENFYTQANQLLQQQLDLITRIEQALISPDANRMRAVRGQLTVQTKIVEGFLKRQNRSSPVLCNPTDASPLPGQLDNSQTKIYCSLSAASQELLKLAPVLDQLLSRRGELALVRKLPLINGERQSDPVMAMKPIQRPYLNQPATPFSTTEPNLELTNQPTPRQSTEITSPSTLPIIGRITKTAIANYVPPIQPAIAAPETVLTILATAKQMLTAVQTEFPAGTKFRDSQETTTALDRFAYGLDPQEPQTYAKFLRLPHTGIFRALPTLAYQRPLNTLWNRLQPSVSERYPFPALGNTQGGFNPSLALQVVGDRFKLQDQGVDYSFMVDVGDIPLEKLDHQLKSVALPTREFFLNYQPPKELAALPVERRRFITGKDQNWNQSQVILASATAKLHHTYIVRSLQFQLPEILLNRQLTNLEQSRYIDQLKQIRSSDIILAFRPVRSRTDGSYTILWRVLNELPAPQISY